MNISSVCAVGVLSTLLLAAPANAQTREQGPAAPQVPVLTVGSNLVLVPALVRTKSGDVVFSLTADDFSLTDDGVPQHLRLDPDTDSQPVAIAVIVQTGGLGASHLADYRDLDALLDAIVGGVPHRIAVVSFDSKPHLRQDFNSDTDAAARTIANLSGGDQGAAILDALSFGISLLSKQPREYRRAVLLFSETIDSGSGTSLGNAIRAVDNTNTAIYSFAFSSTKAAVGHEASKLPRPGGSAYSDQPYRQGGCMSREAGADPDTHGRRSLQALDCASDLLPPLRLARMVYIAARDGLARNAPKSVAELTGGEYFGFKNARTLSRDLVSVSNDIHNYYILSFRPQSPHTGFHALQLRLKDRPGLRLTARKAYWVEAGAEGNL